MWFLMSVLALVFWSGSDIFSKIGSPPNDRYSHLKMVSAVGIVMGIHAFFEIFVSKTAITLNDILTYLPASALYILSMVIGYVALRYIELSISSPICNCSGAVAAVLCLVFFKTSISKAGILAIALVTLGIILLGIFNLTEDNEARKLRQQKSNIKYSKSLVALLLPVLYCFIDALGTFIDSLILSKEPTQTFLDSIFAVKLSEQTANVAYELTFLFMGILCAIYVFLIKKEPIIPKKDSFKLMGGVCETVGQFAYIFAMGDTLHVAPAAAIISSYCMLSALLSRILLKEKLSFLHYLAITITAVGIVMLGILDM